VTVARSVGVRTFLAFEKERCGQGRPHPTGLWACMPKRPIPKPWAP